MKNILLALALAGATLGAQAALTVATFEDTPKPADEPTWVGPVGETVYGSGSFAFKVENFEFYWDGYAVSSETETYAPTFDYQFRSAAGGAYEGDCYAVFYPSFPNSENLLTVDPEEGAVISGMWLTNSAYAYTCMHDGLADYGITAFKEGDFMLLTATGYDAEGNETAALDYYLADYRAETPEADRYILDTWAWMPLAKLGTVKHVKLSFSSSQNNDWGNLLPEYVCIDNLGGVGPEGGLDSVLADASATLEARVYPVPMEGVLNVDTAYDGAYSLELYAANGMRVWSAAGLRGSSSHSGLNVAPGAYLLRIIAADPAVKPLTRRVIAL